MKNAKDEFSEEWLMVNATENGKLCMIGDCAASMNTGILKSQWTIASEIGNDKLISASN